MKNIFKTFICVALGVLLMLSVVACNNNQGGENPMPDNYERPSNANIDSSFTPMSNILVAYFSKTNTTKGVAEKIQDLTDADIFEIERKDPYPSAYTPTTEVAQDEKDANARPELSVYITDEAMAQYDTIILGFPIWWHTAPMPVLSFLNYYDVSGKTIYTFCTAASSGIAESTADIRNNANGATVIQGLKFHNGSDSAIETWLVGLELTETPEVPNEPENPNEPVTPSEPEVPTTPGAFNPPQDSRPGNENTNSLVVYFSMPETTDPNNMTTEEANSTVVIDGVVLGNTQYMAYVIQETSGADIFRIIPKVPYSTDHRSLVDLASEEKAQSARPAIKETITNLEKYDNIFIGYPNWWGDMPMIMYTFFETYDFSGKTIIPFNTHGGSGFSSTISAIRNLEPNAIIRGGLTISRNNIQDAEQQIVTWVTGLGIVFTKPSQTPDNSTESKVVVAYFSASGNTERVAQYIATATGGDLFEIVPVNLYSRDDLNWTVSSSRVNYEHENVSARDIALVSTTVANWEGYDTVFIGYPIWWGIAAWPINNFVKNNDFTGKTVIPFATAASSGMGQSGTLLKVMAGTGNWQDGRRFYECDSQSIVTAWVNGRGGQPR